LFSIACESVFSHPFGGRPNRVQARQNWRGSDSTAESKMPFVGLGLHLVVALFFAVHAVRTGREMYWLIILFSFPLLGSIAYFFAVYLSQSRLEHGVNKVARGAMLAVPLPEMRVKELLGEELSLAAVNAPSLTVVSGPTAAIADLQKRLASEGIETKLLRTSHAFHSAMMEPILDRFAAIAADVTLNAPTVPFISNVTGAWITAEQATDPQYWAQHLRQPVRFADGVRELLQGQDAVLLEVGPGRTLSTIVAQQQQRGARQLALATLPQPHKQQSDLVSVFDALGRLWVAGLEVNWESFHGREQLRRVPLPTYPFERQRYWLESTAIAPRPTAARHGLHKAVDIADWFYSPIWKQARRSDATRHTLEGGTESYLIFADECGVGRAVAERLSAEGRRVVTVALGRGFGRLAQGDFTIDPRDARHYEELLADLRAQGSLPQSVVHCWSLSAEEIDAAVESKALCGFYSLLHLTQALGKHHLSKSLRLSVVTSGAQEVTGEETLKPWQAGALGLCKVIAQEYPHITCRNIDIVPPRNGSAPSRETIDELVSEILGAGTESLVAFRGKYRWAQVFEVAPAQSPDDRTTLLREGGVYLVTGGFGRIGLLLAENLARATRARLALVGRSPLPAREEWTPWLNGARGESSDISRRIRAIMSLESAGAEVLTLQADVVNEAQMRAAVEATVSRFGALHGVIHAAGETRGALIQDTDAALCEAHFNAKARGAFVLERVLRGRRLDFCMLLSSLASVLGGLGYSAYTAASAVMDVAAGAMRAPGGTPWISVNLDGWNFSDETGAPTVSLAELTMTPHEGLEVLRRALVKETAAQVVVSTGDLQSRLEQWVELASVRNEDHRADNIRQFHERPQLTSDYLAPRTDTERAVAEIWQRILGVEQIGVNDDFFALGGHSLLAMQIVSHLRREFQVEIGLRRLLEAPTVAGLAESIEAARRVGHDSQTPPIAPVPRDQRLPLSFSQQRLWFLHQMDPDSPLYNLSSAFRLVARLDVAAVEHSLNEVARRHEVLRTTITEVDGEAVQTIASELKLPLPVIDLSLLPAAKFEEVAQRLATAEALRHFHLARGPLLRVVLLRLSEESHIMILTLHHIVYDWWSTRLLVRELTELYEAFSQGRPSPLPEFTIQYADYAAWQRDWLQGEVLEAQLAYWRGQLGGELPILNLPTDKPRSPVQTFNGRLQPLEISATVAESLEAMSQREGVTLFMTLLAAFNLLLYRYTGQEDIIVGVPVAGRTRAEFEHLIGFFVNTLALRTDLFGEPSFRELLRRVRETCLGAYAHQDLPFERLVEELQPARDLSRNPIFQVSMAFQQEGGESIRLTDLEISQIEVESRTAKFDLTLYVMETERGVKGALEYNIDIFDVELVASTHAQMTAFSPLPLYRWFHNCNTPEDMAGIGNALVLTQ